MNRPGELHDALQRLKRATHDLQQHWSETKSVWNDQAAQQFEARHLEPILPILRLVFNATGELDESFRKTIRQCRDRDRGELEG